VIIGEAAIIAVEIGNPKSQIINHQSSILPIGPQLPSRFRKPGGIDD